MFWAESQAERLMTINLPCHETLSQLMLQEQVLLRNAAIAFVRGGPPSTYTVRTYSSGRRLRTRSAMRTRPEDAPWPRSCSGRCSAFLVVVSLVSSRLREMRVNLVVPACYRRGGLCDDPNDGLLHELGEGLPTQGSGQVPSPIEPFEPSELAAGLCDRGHSPSARQRADPGVVRRPLRGRNRDF
jgi:hypothetical protein